MKRLVCLMIICLPLLTMAQTSNENKTEGGIKWTTGLSWEQVKQKAKAENKYIFVDAYTTWCGPCKMMDKYVYPNDTVGNFFNEKFISVKAQMDVTDKDDQMVRDWYDDAINIRTAYAIEAYPSFIFLSPDGKIVQKEQGYRPVQQFIAIGKDALKPGITYDDPYKGYNRLVAEYKQGIKHYDSMPMMIKTASKINEADLAIEMFKDHLNYTSTLSEDKRYTKENLELWASYVLKLDSKALQFFLKDSAKIDKVMGKPGFSAIAVDKTIKGRIVDSFFRMQKGETTIISGAKIPNSEIMFMRLPKRADGKRQPDYVEADWRKLKKMIRKHFNKGYTARNVYWAKFGWYGKHQNQIGASQTFFNRLGKYPPVDLAQEYVIINQIAWETFLYVNDKKLLQIARGWMEKIIQHGDNESGHLDTYANLLYKLGHINEAIQWQEKAVKLNPNDKSFSKTLEQIKKGEPTYLEEGAIWSNKK